MKNRERNNHFVQRNALYLYCLRGNLVVTLLDPTVLTSVFRPPPPQTSLLNITTHYDKTTLKVLLFYRGCTHTSILDRCGFLLLHSALCYR